jgi:RNA polymerase sigma-70 factor (ECF subfamily)
MDWDGPMSDDPTTQIQSWIEHLQAGNPSAARELINCACRRLELLTRKMLRAYPGVHRWEQTDDVVQNAAIRLYRTLQEVTPSSARAFFHLAAVSIRRELIDLARHYYGPEGAGAHHQSNGDVAGSHPPPYETADASGDPSRLAAWGEFHRLIEGLPEEEREVFDLLWYQGLTQGQAAAVLDLSERTVKRRWQGARLRLHQAMHGEPPDG